MKQETFQKAQELRTKMQDIEHAIGLIEDKPRLIISLPFVYEDEHEAVKNNLIKFLKARKAQYQKEFDLLK